MAVAIACARGDARLDLVLDAVLAQVDDPVVALAEEAIGLESIARDRGVRVIHSGSPGIAAARNAALAACESPIVALLDDDVRPKPGWLEAHARVWSDAPAELVIVGGPITSLVVGRRPRWLSDDLLDVFGAVDHRLESGPIDGMEMRLLAGNVSLRLDAVAGLGGFWPMRGHPYVRGWYDSEALLQRDAAETGWEVRWLAEAAAERLIDGDHLRRRGMLALRRRHGALVGAVGNNRPAATAARQAITSTLGTPIALLSGSEARAIGRIARTVENTAVLVGERTAAEMLAPTGPTAFRPTVAMPSRQRPWRRSRRSTAVVLLYHRIDDSDHDPLGLCVSRQHFAEHVRILERRAVVPLDELAGSVRRRGEPRGVAISFDDGYADNLVNAAPVLAEAGLPATVFVATGHVASGEQFAWDVVADALLGPGERPCSLTLELGSRRWRWRTDTARGRRIAHDLLQAWLRALPSHQAESVVTYLRDWASQPELSPRRRPMTVAELGTLAATPGISIGAHSQRHVSLARQDESTRQTELSGSRDDLASWIGLQPNGIAYPYGVPGEDVDVRTTSSARKAGYDYGVVNSAAAIRNGSDPMALPRIAVPNLDGDAFERMLDLAIAGRG